MKWFEDYNKFFEIFKKYSTFADETVFYFKSDINKYDHYIGYLPEYDKPYWAGYCDIPDGCEFESAEELFNAKIYNGKSIKERWKDIILLNISGVDINEWADMYGVNVD